MDTQKKILGMYLGRQLDKLVQEGMSKKWKATFRVINPDSQEQQDWNFAAFTKLITGEDKWVKKDLQPRKGSDFVTLKEGETYNISYTEYQVDDMDYPAKTIQNLYHSKPSQASIQAISGQNVNAQQSAPQQQQSVASGAVISSQQAPIPFCTSAKPMLTVESFEKFLDAYAGIAVNLPPEQRTMEHMKASLREWAKKN